MTVICGKYEWDDEKCRKNIEKHGLDFQKILDIFDDPYFYEIYDAANSSDIEERYIGVGMTGGFVLVVASYTDRNGRTRIISARKADKKDGERYYECRKNFEG